MKFLVVDDEKLALRGIIRMLSKVYPSAEIISTQNPVTAQMLFDKDVDVAFLDVEMPGMTGIELGELLLQEKKNLNVIYITAYSDYAVEAYRIHASGYLTKPLDEKQLRKEMENLRYPLEQNNEILKVKCFGNFEVFCGGMPVHFSRSSSKEVLAYLIDRRGATVTIDELCSNFWEESTEMEKKKSYMRTMIKSLRKTLEEYGLKDLLVSRRNSYAVNPAYLDCDYYKYLNDAEVYGDLFHGEYMSQYSWAERTLGNLSEIVWEQRRNN